MGMLGDANPEAPALLDCHGFALEADSVQGGRVYIQGDR